MRIVSLGEDRLREIHKFDAPSKVACIAISPDGRRALCGGDDGSVTGWDLDSLKPIRSTPGRQDSVRCVTFLPDGRHAVWGTQRGRLVVWDFAEWRELTHFDQGAGHLGIAALPGSFRVLTADADGVVRLWQLP